MKPLYAAVVVALVISVAIIARTDKEWVARIAEIPAIGSMFAGLYLLMRDRITHERAIFLQQTQNAFALGATSHMANVAFDKHVSFGEEYVTEVFATLRTLYREGPCAEALNHASNLHRIREKWALWVTPEVGIGLEKFEQALRTIGAAAHVNDSFPGGDAVHREARAREMFARFAEVLGFEKWEGADVSQEQATSTIIKNLQNVLGTAELTTLRTEFVKRALRSQG
ncbi:MAG: hypothetical protein ACR2IF_04700 [Terriglobales bacterium]